MRARTREERKEAEEGFRLMRAQGMVRAVAKALIDWRDEVK